MKPTVLLFPILLCSCASVPGLYVDIGGGIKNNSSTSRVLQDFCDKADIGGGEIRSCGGPDLTAHFEVGYITEGGLYIQGRHWSHPFNGSEPETHKDEVEFGKRFGGR